MCTINGTPITFVENKKDTPQGRILFVWCGRRVSEGKTVEAVFREAPEENRELKKRACDQRATTIFSSRREPSSSPMKEPTVLAAVGSFYFARREF